MGKKQGCFIETYQLTKREEHGHWNGRGRREEARDTEIEEERVRNRIEVTKPEIEREPEEGGDWKKRTRRREGDLPTSSVVAWQHQTDGRAATSNEWQQPNQDNIDIAMLGA